MSEFFEMQPDRTIAAVLPCYNQGSYAREAVDSLLSQTHVPDEIVIVDDGSDDPDTLAELNGEWPHPVRIVRRENGGAAAARNTGFRETASEYVLTLDTDDLLEKTFVERALVILESDDSAGAVTSWLRLFGVSEGLWKSTGGFAPDFLAGNQSGPNALMRRSFWDSAGGYDESMRKGFEDWEFWISGTSNSGQRVVIIPEPLSFYRKRDERTGLTVAYENKPEIVKYVTQKHEALYCEHVANVLYEKEALIDRIYRSEIYQAGLAALGKRSPIA
jgi:glycosyltransferase involved in cell wall biosynthesis